LARFSQLGRMELSLRQTDLDTLLTEVLTSLAATLLESGAQVRRSRPLPVEQCDGVLVREVLLNLIANAIKYNDKPDKWVEISYRDAPEEDSARGPVFYVRDNGIGIRERNLDAVFQMFRRLNREKFGPGSGAGLAITKSIIERHGGRIWVESTYGEGSTFCFTLR
jgi:chemotaxis family two-component system sensor kinase Cph1